MAKKIKRLHRSKEKDSMVGGVCAGIADYLAVDPTFIRLLWVLVTIFTGFFPGALAYLVMWAIMPEK